MCFYRHAIIGTSAAETVNVNCLAQDPCYKTTRTSSVLHSQCPLTIATLDAEACVEK
jgi:hypothetical protein